MDSLRPMAEFDPSASALVHDRINDRTFEWSPARMKINYMEHAREVAPGTMGRGYGRRTAM
jgi:hypothetical protein